MTSNDQDLWVLWDLRGLTLHCYHSGTDPDSNEKNVVTPGHTIQQFVDRYLLPATKLVPLNRIIAVNDAGNFFRKTIYPEYKANRPEPEPQIKVARENSRLAMRELLHSLGILQVTVPNTEGDDVIAYLSERLPGSKLIYTVDGDLVALSKNENTTVFLKDEPTHFLVKDGAVALPKHIALFKSIVGDSSDNIKGVPGAGPKFWVKLEEEFGLDGLDELVEILEEQDIAKLASINDDVQSHLLATLLEKSREWLLSYNVAKLRPELVDGRQGKEFTRPKWEKRLPNRDRLISLSEKINCPWLLDDLSHLLPEQYLVTAKDWDDTCLDEAKELFKQSRFISIDWETWDTLQHPAFNEASKSSKTGYVDMLSSKISGLGVTCGENLEHTFYFCFDHANEDENIDKKHLLELLKLIPQGMPTIAQNAIFERTVLLNELGYDLPNLHDTKIMASHVDEASSSGLKDMSKRWLNYDQTRYSDVIEKGKTMKDYPASHVFKYGADDPLVTAHLYDLFQIILMTEGTWDFVRDNEFIMTYPLSDGFLAGCSVDYDEVARQHAEDKETFDTNMAKVRQSLRENVTQETIYQGASNWMDELVRNKKAEADTLLDRLHEANKRGNLKQFILEDKLAQGWLKSYVSKDDEEINFNEVIASLNQEFRHVTLREGRAELWAKAVDAATYEDYSETPTESKFQWRIGCLNQLSEYYGLTEWSDISNIDVVNEQRSSFINPSLAAKEYIDHVAICACADKANARTKTSSYAWLKAKYSEAVPGKIEKRGKELNLDSPLQMSELLYALLGLPIKVRAFEPSDSRAELGLDGAAQTNEDAIKTAIAEGDATGWKKEVLDLTLEAKKASTRIKFFYSKLPLWQHPLDGQIHPQFNSTGTETRRPSGSAPNMLQLSKKGEGVKVRRCFVPNKKLGHNLIVSIDWDAQELRVIAGLSQDENMKACYIGDNLLDIHSKTASEIMRVDYETFIKRLKSDDDTISKKYKDARAYAKNTNFGSAYGIGKAKLARQILRPEADAQQFLDAKKAAYPGVEDWKVDVKNDLHAHGFVSTVFGSRKHLFNKLGSSEDGLVSYYDRASVNFKIQGACADYLKKVLADIHRKRIFQRNKAVLIAPIYDELVMSCHDSNAVNLIKEVYAVMTQGMPGIDIPMLASPSVGVNFADQIEILDKAVDPLTDEKIQEAIDKALGRIKEEAA